MSKLRKVQKNPLVNAIIYFESIDGNIKCKFAGSKLSVLAGVETIMCDFAKKTQTPLLKVLEIVSSAINYEAEQEKRKEEAKAPFGAEFE